MHVVIRADGGPEIGYGHLVRTGALGSELLDRGHDVTYATTTPEHVREVCPAGVNTETVPSRDAPSPVRDFVRDHADVTVTDSYLVDGAYQQQLRDVSPLVVIADDTRHAIAADVLVNGNFYAADLKYEVIGPQPEWCLGPDYLLLRSAITDYASKDPSWRETPTRAIVTMGGSDIADMTPIVMQAFDEFDIQVDTIVGPGVPPKQKELIEETATSISADIRVTRDPNDLPERMFQADFAVTTASTTTYELLALGIPMISVPVIENQELIAESLRARNLATVLDRNPKKEEISCAISRYFAENTLRKDRRDRGCDLIDGQGATRIVDVIVNMS
ncbi:UDP-2,4-diacetamido-2,4,6-trideoxy-beta-L-altropyranose hydrolase [Halorubrum sp. FL23]|uniref:UDP-2,4-diacetamido-2,4, 6-trideoxy-beta-L-altropyranose hydrolase n=1 Tax=Halorubrum sp. FL23 TaxID=3458704 RepID=UPI0040335788